MSYQVLARKWRPRSFAEMVGQTHVLRALINALDHQRLHHAYLFTGTRGVGKTTIARIIAKCLNCEEGVSSTPCGVCSTCREIDEGRFVDLIEVDAASRTKVEDTRELLDNVQYAPTRGRYKVYLIDEVHMLSTHSFNALLKTLEEPPPHVKFLLATTDPQKLPVTILSRCLQFSLKSMPPERVVDHLKTVLSAEQIPFDDDALWQLGRAADGSMRDAMSLTDQAIAFGEGKVTADDVRSMLGTLDQGQVLNILRSVVRGNAAQALADVEHLAEFAPEWPTVLADFLTLLHRVALAQVVPGAVDNSQGDRDNILELARSLPAEDVQFYYQTGLVGRRDLPLAPDLRSGFEMVLLRMLAFRPAGSAIQLQAPVATEGRSDAPIVAEIEAVAEVADASESYSSVPEQVAPAEVETAVAVEEVVDVPWDDDSVAATAEVITPPKPEASLPELAPEPVMAPVESVVSDDAEDESDNDEPPPYSEADYLPADALAYWDEPSDAEKTTPAADLDFLSVAPATGLAAQWQQIYDGLQLGGLTGSIAANCTLVAVQEQQWTLHLDPDHSALFNPTQQSRLNDALQRYLGQDIQLLVEIKQPTQETPAQAAARARYERQKAAEASIQNDPCVQQLIERFGAQVRLDTIEPVNPIPTDESPR